MRKGDAEKTVCAVGRCSYKLTVIKRDGRTRVMDCGSSYDCGSRGADGNEQSSKNGHGYQRERLEGYNEWGVGSIMMRKKAGLKA